MTQNAPLATDSLAEMGEHALGAMSDPEIFGRHFQPEESWYSWQTVLAVLFHLQLTEGELPLFEKCTGRTQQFDQRITQALLLCGRRSGKSRVLAFVATILACFRRDYSAYLAPGERAIVMVLAADRDQAQVIFQYVRALLVETPLLAGLIERETADELQLTNRVTIGIYTSSYRSIRGRSCAAALCDEICFWRDDTSRDPASAVLAALRPALATIPGSLLLCASSVYARSGIAYELFSKHWGQNASSTLVWKATTLEMNPSFSVQTIEAARLEDPASASSEYDSEFRSDVAGFLLDADIDAAIDRGIRTRPMVLGFTYVAFCDMSGGRSDAATLAIAHQEGGRIVVDKVEVAESPHDPNVVTARFAEVLSSYALGRVTGDNYSGEWVPAAFAKHRIAYSLAELSTSEIFLETLPLFTTGLLSLPDHAKLEAELRQLERRPKSQGRDAVGHPKGGHDDVANSALGAAWLASRQSGYRFEGESVTHAITSYDPMTRDSERQVRRPRAVGSLAGMRFEEEFDQALRNYDPLDRD
jgi:hypothetical protein